MNITSTQTIELIIEKTSEAIRRTGINPCFFIDLLAEDATLEAFSQYRLILFQSLYDKYRSDVQFGAINPEHADYSAMLYEMFHDTEEHYRSLLRKREEELISKNSG